jgi:DNA-binding PadR family transcriptional regulator
MSKNELAILGLLAEGPKHGYQIHQQIKFRHMEMWAKINMASIYNTLTRLDEQGLITPEKERVGNMPERTVYSITASGLGELGNLVLAFLRADERPWWPFLLGVAFIYGAARQQVLEVLQIRRKELGEHLESFKKDVACVKGSVPFNWSLLVESGEEHMRFELDWLDRLITHAQSATDWITPGNFPNCIQEQGVR